MRLKGWSWRKTYHFCRKGNHANKEWGGSCPLTTAGIREGLSVVNLWLAGYNVPRNNQVVSLHGRLENRLTLGKWKHIAEKTENTRAVNSHSQPKVFSSFSQSLDPVSPEGPSSKHVHKSWQRLSLKCQTKRLLQSGCLVSSNLPCLEGIHSGNKYPSKKRC